MDTIALIVPYILAGFVGFVALFGIGCTLQGPNAQTVMATIGAIMLFGFFWFAVL